MEIKKKHKLTYVKPKKSDYTTYSAGKKEVYGEYALEPEVGRSFIFLDYDDIGDGVVTSTVVSIKKDLEPGITYIETRNSIYKLEDYNESN
jgi:hypothetical protein